jgi:hypothetical protein
MTSRQWRTSSHSGTNGNCVEVAALPGVALVRDTKDRTGGHLAVPAEEWVSFLATLKHGDPIQ